MLTKEVLELLKGIKNGTIGGVNKEYVNEQINNLKDSVNPNLDTLNKIANAINDDVNFHTTITQAIAQALTESKEYTDIKINTIDLIDIQVLATLPPSGESDILYMIGNVNTTDIFELYIWENNKFIKVGSTTIDLSQYALKSELPKKLSELINDTNFITQGDIPTNLSSFTNDVGYITNAELDIPTNLSEFNNDSGFITVNDIIDDNSSNTNKTYSSNKIDQLLQTVQPISNAQEVSYVDNKDLGVNNVQEAIDKTVDKIPSNANQITFTSTQGIIASDVGGALDEIKTSINNNELELNTIDEELTDIKTSIGHTHLNKVILDNFNSTDNRLTYDNKKIIQEGDVVEYAEKIRGIDIIETPSYYGTDEYGRKGFFPVPKGVVDVIPPVAGQDTIQQIYIQSMPTVADRIITIPTLSLNGENLVQVYKKTTGQTNQNKNLMTFNANNFEVTNGLIASEQDITLSATLNKQYNFYQLDTNLINSDVINVNEYSEIFSCIINGADTLPTINGRTCINSLITWSTIGGRSSSISSELIAPSIPSTTVGYNWDDSTGAREGIRMTLKDIENTYITGIHLYGNYKYPMNDAKLEQMTDNGASLLKILGENPSVGANNSTPPPWFFEFTRPYNGKVTDFVRYKITDSAMGRVLVYGYESKDILIYSNDQYYSVDEKYYNIETKSYTPLTISGDIITEAEFKEFSFKSHLLTKEINLNDETFQPLLKFENIQIIMNETNYEGIVLDIKGMKNNLQTEYMTKTSIPIAGIKEITSLEPFITGDLTNCKFVLTDDRGISWKTTNDNGITWEIIDISDLENIVNEGIPLSLLSNLPLTDFINKGMLGIKIAVKPNETDIVFSKISIIYDKLDCYSKLPETNYAIDVYPNGIEITFSADHNDIKINVL